MERNNMIIELDGRLMTDQATAHTYLKAKLSLPEHYGRNLDALFDLLTEMPGSVTITILHMEAFVDNLGSYGSSLLKTFRDAAEKNPALTIHI